MFGRGVQLDPRPASAGKCKDTLARRVDVRGRRQRLRSRIKGTRGYHDLWSRTQTRAAHEGCQASTTGTSVTISAVRRSWNYWRRLGLSQAITDWQTISPDETLRLDCTTQRFEFAHFYPLGSPEAKAGRADDTVFTLFSNGYTRQAGTHISTTSHVKPVLPTHRE